MIHANVAPAVGDASAVAAHDGPLTAYTSMSTATQMYFSEVSGALKVASSVTALRRQVDAKLDESRVSLALCSNLPGVLRGQPFWRDIQLVPPGHELSYDGASAVIRRRWEPAALGAASAADVATEVRDALTAAVGRRVEAHGHVSSDLSGGMDSTSLAYLLASITRATCFYHSRTEDRNNHDTVFARRAAAELAGTYVELEPFTSTMSAFGNRGGFTGAQAQDGPWAWASNAEHLRRLLTDAAARGVRSHITGLGGDELFAVLPTLALALWQKGQWVRGARAIVNMARMQRWPVASALGQAVRRRPFGSELVARVRSRKRWQDGPSEAFAWAPGFGMSPFATDRARELAEDRILTSATSGVTPWFSDKHRHQIVEAVTFQGEVIRQMNQAFAQLGVAVEAPMLDDDVLSVVLGCSPEVAAGREHSKSLLAAAVRNVVPAWLLERPDKGEYSSDLFRDLNRSRSTLAALFADSYLIDNGYVDAAKVREALEAPTVGTQQLFDLEQVVTLERWVRGVA